MEIQPKRLFIGLLLIFILGILFALVNGYYAASTNMQLPLIVYAISFVSIIIGASIMLMFQFRISKRQVESILKILPREERIIVQILLDNRNMLEQNKLVVLSSLSKVKVSRVLKELELRGVVQKKNMGNTNLVLLKL